jgi:hypothetical protein
MFIIYLKRAAEAFGVTHTREIYEKAIEVLPDKGARYKNALTLLHVLLPTNTVYMYVGQVFDCEILMIANCKLF